MPDSGCLPHAGIATLDASSVNCNVPVLCRLFKGITPLWGRQVRHTLRHLRHMSGLAQLHTARLLAHGISVGA